MKDLKRFAKRVFPERFADEELVYVERKHPLLLIKELFLYGLVLALIAALPRYASRGPEIAKIVSWDKFWMIYMGAGAVVSALAYARYYEWKYDLFLVTNQRIIDYNRYFPFRRIVTEAELTRVQDSSYTVPGPGGQLFDYGNH
jgi:hypothetical protein